MTLQIGWLHGGANWQTAKMFGWFEAGGYRADLAALRRVSPDLTTLASWLASGSWTPPKS